MNKVVAIGCCVVCLCALCNALSFGQSNQSALEKEYDRKGRASLQAWLGFLRDEQVIQIIFVPQIRYPSKSDPFFNQGPPAIDGGRLGVLERKLLADFLNVLQKPEKVSIWERGCDTVILPIFDRPGPRPPFIVESSFSDDTILMRFRSFDGTLLGDCMYGRNMMDLLKDYCVKVSTQK